MLKKKLQKREKKEFVGQISLIKMIKFNIKLLSSTKTIRLRCFQACMLQKKKMIKIKKNFHIDFVLFY
jgi:hypothetical protein